MTRARDRSLAGLSAALLPPEVGGPNPCELAGRIRAFLSDQPRFLPLAARGGAIAVDLASVLMTGHRLDANVPERRESVLRNISNFSRTTGMGLDGMKALVLLVAGTEWARENVLVSGGSTEATRLDATLDVVSAEEWPSVGRCDAVIVGSGAGGAMAARTLARAGMSVVVIEEGRRHGVEEFRTEHPLERFSGLYRDGGATAAIGRPPVILPIGRGVGGTTLVNSGTCYRTPERVLRRWRDDEGIDLADPGRFGAYLDEVWAVLEVGPVPLEIMGRNGKLVLRGAEVLGWSAAPLQRNAPGCGGCCQCSIGCPRNAKFGVHLNALPQACEAGARVIAAARVERVLTVAGRVRGVLARRSDGSIMSIETSRVIVAAGTTETPPLLRRSGLAKHPMLGRNMAVHPALDVAGRFESPVVSWKGVLQSASVEEFHESLGILLEATATPPGMGSMLFPGFGRELMAELSAAAHMAHLGAMVADLPAGRVIGRRKPLLVYNVTGRDASRLVEAIGIAGRVLFAAGADEVITGVRGHQRARTIEELDDATAHAEVRDLHLAAFHPVGTAAAGSDPERHPVGPDGRLRGMRGVWVADGSLLPTCPEVNPQVSIMAMALAVAEGIVSCG